MTHPLECFFGIEGHAVLDIIPGPGSNTVRFRFIPVDFYSACLHRQFLTLLNLLKSQGALPNSYPIPACQAGRQFVPFYNTSNLWCDPTGARTPRPTA